MQKTNEVERKMEGTENQNKKALVKEAVGMAWPAVCESFFIALAGIVDTYMVSSMGASAVAAVGLTTQPKFMGLALFIALSVAISALVARRRGQERKEDANQILLSALIFTVVMAAVISFLTVGFANHIIAFCGSTPDTHEMAVSYYRIIMAGIIFNGLSQTITAAQRGAGNTKISMRTNLISNLVNIVGNYLLIQGHFGFPKLGIQGAAIATVFGTFVACVISILSIMRRDGFVSIPYILANRLSATFLHLGTIIRVGYSVFIEQILTRIGFMSTAMMAAKMGTNPMAAHQVGMNILGLTFSFGDGMQIAAVALIGRSLGEKNPEKAKEYGMICRRIGLFISIVLAFIYFVFGRTIYQMFFREEDIVAVGVNIMHVIIFIVLFQVSQVIYMGCLRGAGDTVFTAMASTVSVTIIRTAASYVFGFTLGLGMTGIWFGVLADQISRFLLASTRFKKGKWVHIKI